MLWLIAIGCLAVGTVIGVIAAGRLSSTSPARIKEMESRIEHLQEQHSDYRNEVSSHFNTTAELVQQMTESYREVYQHLATGAQELCSEDVADKMLPPGEGRMFQRQESSTAAEAPKDYAANRTPDREGALSESFGLNRSASAAEAQQQDPAPTAPEPQDTASAADTATEERTDESSTSTSAFAPKHDSTADKRQDPASTDEDSKTAEESKEDDLKDNEKDSEETSTSDKNKDDSSWKPRDNA